MGEHAVFDACADAVDAANELRLERLEALGNAARHWARTGDETGMWDAAQGFNQAAAEADREEDEYDQIHQGLWEEYHRARKTAFPREEQE